MEKIQLNIHINASRQKVWQVLWNDDTYRKWTAAFTEGSHAVSDWEQGSAIRFMDGQGNGMYSVIEKKEPETCMVFKHLGELKNNEEHAQDWAGALESYTLSGEGNSTELLVEMDANDEYKSYFENTFPLALQKIKELSENP